LAKLVGVSAQSIYNWEHAVTRPRETQLGTLVALRSLGKKEVRARLQQLEGVQAAKRAASASRSSAQKPSKRRPRRGAKK